MINTVIENRQMDNAAYQSVNRDSSAMVQVAIEKLYCLKNPDLGLE
jgi:hypothetical protein